jgi:hypothetical protein
MVNRPQAYLNWTDGNPSKVQQPPANYALAGWQSGQAPPPEYMNWLFWLADQWIQYLDPLITGGMPDQAMRLLNGGTWAFSATSGDLSWSSAFNIVIPSVPDSSNQVNAGSVTLSDGELAYVNLNSPLVAQGNTVNSSNSISALTFINGITVGMNVTGPGIPANTTVTAVGSNSVTISNNATSTQNGATFVFSAAGPITVQTASSASFVPGVNQIIFARRSGPVVYLGVNTSQIILRDGEYKPLLGSGYFTVYEVVAGQNLTAGQVVYISPGNPTDSGRTAGRVYPLDCSPANQAVRGTFAGMVISDVSSGGVAEVLYNGFYSLTSLVAGAEYYADPSTPGGIVTPAPTGAGEKIVPVGVAVTTTHFLVSGTPSNSGPTSFPILATDPPSTGNGTTTAFDLLNLPLSAQSIRVSINGRIIPDSEWSLSGQTITFNSAPALASQILFEYVLANQGYLAMNQETPVNTGDNLTFRLGGSPFSKSGVSVYIDGLKILPSQFSLTQGTVSYIVLSSALPVGSSIYCDYFSPVGGGSGGGSGGIAGMVNLDGGIGLFAGVMSGIAQLKGLVPGTNMTLTDMGDHVILSSSGGGGGGMIDAHGSKASPIVLTPSSGLTPANSNDQVWWIAPTSGGVTPITATPQIAAGTTIGQRLTLKGADPTNYYTLADGNGLDLNGPISLTDNQSIELMWDGSVWSENNRRA